MSTRPAWLDSLLLREGRVRAGWRILFYFLVFAFLSLAGQFIIVVLPRTPLQWGSQIVATAAALLAGWIAIAHFDDRPFGALGFPLHRHVAREVWTGLLFGGALIGGAVLLLLLSRTLAFAPDEGAVPGYLLFLTSSLLFFAIAAAWEEAVFRGYPFQTLVVWIGPWPATVIAASLFAFLHGQNPNVTPLAVVNIFLAGVLLSLAYLRTRSLWFATAVHLGWNWSMAGLFDLPVSGLLFDTPLYDGVPTGNEWWTGGPFGPEAGLVGTIVLAAGTLWLIRTRRVGEDEETRRLRPLVDDRLEGGRR